jgi:hypothetical protein
MKSNWELGKELSNYHFDKSIKDEDAYQTCGRFVGDWKDELEEAYKNMASVTWNNRWSKHGKKDPRGDLSENEIKDIVDAGGDPDMSMYQGSYVIGPAMQKMIDILGMNDSRPKLHIQVPGEVVTMHIDKHYDVEDGREARRFLIAMEDWEPGQCMLFGNQLCERWTAGDIITWEWKDMPHATANCSLYKRPMLAVTGVVTEKTQSILNNSKLIYNLD